MSDADKSVSLVELVTGIAILTVVLAIAIPAVHALRTREQTANVAADARVLYAAFKEYRVNHHAYHAELDLTTLEPSRRDGSYAGIVTRMLHGGRLWRSP